MENKRIASPYDGKEANIIGDHPHAGSVAICVGCENTPVGMGFVFSRNDTQEEFFAFKPCHIDWVVIKP